MKYKIPNIKKVISIVSGKGGVGKSTVAASLALYLSSIGKKVGLVDLDIYGPSIPHMFKISEEIEINEGKIETFKTSGIEIMSIGFLTKSDASLIWRGPMLTKAIHQLLKLVNWGKDDDLDYLIMDTPPGTGDIHLTLSQNYHIDSAIVVTTPHELAVFDAFKSVDMLKKLGIPVAGIIENMSYYINGSEKEYVFGMNNTLSNKCKEHGIESVAKIPIDKDLSRNKHFCFDLMSDYIKKEFFTIVSIF